MLIIGAKGFAIQLTDVLMQINPELDLCYYDDVSTDLPEKLFGKYEIIRNLSDAENYFRNQDSSFALGTGNPAVREKFFRQMTAIGGMAKTVISPKAIIGSFQVEISEGATVLSGTVIESLATIGTGCLINLNCTITHEVLIGDFTEISPGVHLSGKCSVGTRSVLGTGSVVLPKIKVGNHVTIAAGSVVNKDIPDYSVAAGIPARVIRKNNSQ